MLRRLPAPQFIHHAIALLRDGKWMTCPCCGAGFGSHQITGTVNGPARLYNRISYMCPVCASDRGDNLVIITPPRPCSCPDCGHVETSLSAMGRHWTRQHGHPDNSHPDGSPRSDATQSDRPQSNRPQSDRCADDRDPDATL